MSKQVETEDILISDKFQNTFIKSLILVLVAIFWVLGCQFRLIQSLNLSVNLVNALITSILISQAACQCYCLLFNFYLTKHNNNGACVLYPRVFNVKTNHYNYSRRSLLFGLFPHLQYLIEIFRSTCYKESESLFYKSGLVPN